MKKIITLQSTRYNGEDMPKGAIFDIDDDLFTSWENLGLAKEHTEEKPEKQNNFENTLKPEVPIKTPVKAAKANKKGQVKKNAKNS